MGDWKKTARIVLGYFLFVVLSLLLLSILGQGWAKKLDSRYFTTGGFVLIVGLTVLLWKKIDLFSRVQLLLTYLLLLIGFCALYYGPQEKTSFMIGPLSLSFLVNLLIFLSLSLSLFLLLMGLKLSRGIKIGIGVFGAICSVPFLIGLIKDIPLNDLLRGEGFLKFIPWFLQPSFLGVVLLLPILLVFLAREVLRARKTEGRSTLHAVLNGLMALVPFLIGVACLWGQGQPGLLTRYFADHSYGSFKKQDIEAAPRLDWKTPPVAPQAGERFWVEWEGNLQVPKEGEYEFKMEGEGKGFLFLDGQRIFGEENKSGKVKLSSGGHVFRAGAIEEKKEGKFAVQWRKKGDETFEPIDPKYLSYQDSQVAWRRTPRQAAQVGVEWLQSASYEWQQDHGCFGCHVQGQVLMGLSIAKNNQYQVNPDYYQSLYDFLLKKQNEDGTYHGNNHVTATQFAAMGMAYVQGSGGKKTPQFLKAVDWLLTQQKESGEFDLDHEEPPIDQGELMTTSNAVVSLMQAFQETGQDKYKKAAERALNWIATAPTQSNQDKVMKVLALSQYGSGAQKQVAGEVVEQLKKEQAPDGGWKETEKMEGSNGYATGQVLYAFKKAGVSINSPEFSKGVRFLLDHQQVTGAWPAEHTQTHRPSEFAPTMWAVIGLAGSFGEIIPEILEPKDKSSVEGQVTIVAQVTNFTDSEIKSVQFELDGKALGAGKKEEAVYVLPWNTASLTEGEHKLKVIAANKEGKQGEAINTVYFGLGVQVKLTSPANASTVFSATKIQAEAKALYGQTIQKVEFFVNPSGVTTPGSGKIGEVSEGLGNNLYGVDWDPSALPDGDYRITAVATNARGQQAQDSLTVTKRQPLSVKLSAPSSGQTVSGLTDCVAQVTNNTDSPVERVEFLLDGENSLGQALPGQFTVPCNFGNVALGAHTLKVVASTAQGLKAEDSIPVTVGETKGPGYLKVELKNLDEAGGEQVLYFPPDVIELVFDISGSMWEQIQGKAKIEIAREVLASLVKGFPKDANFGLRVYGHRSKSDCQDSELLIPFGHLDPDQVIAKVNALKPKGMTLIDYSMREALKDLQALKGSKVLVVVTDGIETCKGDPVKAAQDMVNAGLKMKIHVVGFNISHSPEAVEQLKKVAEVGQGKFYTAENSEEMGQALAEAVKVTYSVFDEQGNLIYTKPLGTESNELMSGNYKIVVALEPLLVLPAVKIEKGKTSIVEVIKQNKAFRIESPQTVAPPAPESMPVSPPK